MANSNFVSQGSPVLGGFAQPSPGITEAIVTPADPSGNAYITSLAASGSANLQTANYRDSIITAQNGSSASHPSAGGTVVSLTPGTAGLWEVIAQVGVGGTTAILVDSNNFVLLAGSGTVITTVTYPVTSTTGSGAVTLPGVILNLGTATALQVVTSGASTAGSIYSATLVARRVG